MTVGNQIKISDRRIKQNKAQYNLNRKGAKISGFFSNKLDKYEYLIGKSLDYKPDTVEQKRLECSPFGKIFNKGRKKKTKKKDLKNKKVGWWKRY